ncbi:MAG: CHASE2 domain-containing protein [Candidatus Binataceae bacterium]
MPVAQIKRARRKFHWKTFALGLGVTAVLFGIFVRYPGLLLTLDLKTSDARMRARPARALSNQVVIAAIDDKSIAELGHWIWPRSVFANLQNAFIDYKVKVVGYDILFSEVDGIDVEREAIAQRLRGSGLNAAQLKSIVGTNNDEQFANAIEAQSATFLSYSFATHGLGEPPTAVPAGYTAQMIKPKPLAYGLVTREPDAATEDLMTAGAYGPPIPILNSAAKGTGFADADADEDGVIRSELTVIKFHTRLCVPLFLGLVWAFEDYPNLGLDIAPFGIRNVTLGDTTIPVDEVGKMMVAYQGPAGTFPNYSVSDVINHRIPAADLAGKIVLVGVTGKGLGDRSVTPAGLEFPRVEIHANAIDDILMHDFVIRTKTDTLVMERAWAAALGVAVSIAAAMLTPAWSILAMVVMAGGYFGFAQYTLVEKGVMLGVLFPLIVAGGTVSILLGYRYVTEGREKGRLRHAFEKYLHPDVISSVVDNPEGLKLGGELREMSILFADIVNYTGLSEETDPVALVALLNDYMTKMTDLILESGGVVDKIRGDGIMAFWGAPAEVPNHERSAIEVALGMLAELKKLRERDPRFVNIDIGIGIATGKAIAGNFGGANRFDYSVIGDTVNLASRLESLTRQFKVHLLVSKNTFTEAGGSYIARDIGMVRVKGKTQHVPIVEVVAHANDGVDHAFYEQFALTIDLIKKGDAQAARDQLENLMTARPDDEVVGLYLEKLDETPDKPPTEIIFEFDTK